MNTLLIGGAVVGSFVIYKFIIEPIMNEGSPIEPPEDYKTFGEKMEESMSTEVNF